MNKTKKELYEENKKLKEQLEAYSGFWEVDALKDVTKTNLIAKRIIYIIAGILLMAASFIFGLLW